MKSSIFCLLKLSTNEARNNTRSSDVIQANFETLFWSFPRYDRIWCSGVSPDYFDLLHWSYRLLLKCLDRLFKPYFVKKMNHGAKKVLFLLLTKWDRPRKWPLKPSCIAAWLVLDMFPQTLAIYLPLQRQWLVIKWLLLCSLIEVIECS